MRRWKKDTEPQADKDARTAAREMRADSRDPMLDLVADTEASLDAERRSSEHLRELLGRVLDVADLPDDLQTAIHAALGGSHVLRQAQDEDATQDVTAAPEAEPQALQWSGNDDDGWLGRGKDVTFAVSEISARGVLHVEARLIASNADFSLPVDKLAEQYGKPLTREVRGKIVPLDIRITVVEAKEACEIAYANPQE